MEESSLLRHGQVAEGHDESGDREWEHGRGVQEESSRAFSTYDDPCDEDSQNERDGQCEACVAEAVDDAWNGEVVP